MLQPPPLGWVVVDRACAAHAALVIWVTPSTASIDRRWPGCHPGECGSALRPGLRRLELRREPEEDGLVAEGRYELDTEWEAGLRPRERERDRRVPRGVEERREAHRGQHRGEVCLAVLAHHVEDPERIRGLAHGWRQQHIVVAEEPRYHPPRA